MSQNRDPESLLDIYNYGQQAIAFVASLTQEEFEEDDKSIAAVMYVVAIMGEATKRLSKEFRQQYDFIPWGDIAGMRDRLVHDYKNIDLDILWDIVNVEIPRLLAQIQPMIPSFEERSE
ncbi:DUF86 domain-containing protein [Pseudanabaena sp. FACHB-1277]|jgi:uncharacterized protein with HEPN domain|uniref:DUF86 domain-containing protein n=1 Tax=Pseudanabaena cinerea FACHB-1277 TaxID=2949581 RepID=A0A926Z6C6_9CYAN|nr:DUF86 domain-containing protein [Pseudanabaena cinerea]MBD2150573.1 DUF86 domain-containing protein [Pseudanabaena cinerea FACHB-1277]